MLYIDEKQVQAELNNEAKNLVKQHQQSGSQSTALAESSGCETAD
nr:hypothetical protein [Lactiplantibacillus plantarum]